MKTSSKLKRVLHWVAKKRFWFVTFLLIVVVILMFRFRFWFLFTAVSPNAQTTTIVIAAIAAIFSAISAIANLKMAVEVKRQRKLLERPYVTAYFDGANNGALYFVIENSGNSPAVDIRFKFDPPPVDFLGRPLNEVSLFSNPISFLPTGKVIRQMINASHTFLENGKTTRFKIELKYLSIWNDPFEEAIEHDLEYLRQVTLPRKTTEDYLEDIGKGIGELASLIKNAQGLNSFLVETPDAYSSRMKSLRNEHLEPNGANSMLQKILVWLGSKLNRG